MSRVIIAFYVISFLIFLSILESVFSFLFSLALQRSVDFPLVQWFFLILEWSGQFLILCVNLFFLFIVVAVDPATYGEQILTRLGDLFIHFAGFPSVLFYPLVLIFGDVLATLAPELIADAVEEAAKTQQSLEIPNVISGIISALTIGLAAAASRGSGGEERDEFSRGDWGHGG